MNKKKRAGVKACDFVEDKMIVGLGTGSTAYYMIEELGRRKLDIKVVATSNQTKKLALEFGLNLLELEEANHIDLTIDGVDEIDPAFNAIKGGGGALLYEKIVATNSSKVIWIMDDSKLKDALGEFYLPVEVIEFGHNFVFRKFEKLGLNPKIRTKDNKVFKTDSNNIIIDLYLEKPIDIKKIKNILNNTAGVVEDGLFLNVCDLIVVGYDDKVEVIENKRKK